MKIKLLIMSILCVFSVSVFSQNLTTEQEKRIRSVVKEYCTLLSAYSRDMGKVNEDDIFKLFGKNGEQNPVVDDLHTTPKEIKLQPYLSFLSSPDVFANKLHIDFLENIDNIKIEQRELPQYLEKSETQKYYAMVLSKKFSGTKNETVYNRISINAQTFELQRVTLYDANIINHTNNNITEVVTQTSKLGSSALLEQGLEYYNTKPKQYENALACFRKAAEMGDNEARYYLAVMLLKGQGSKHIPTNPANVRDAEAMFWLKKLYYSCGKTLYSPYHSRCEDINHIFQTFGLTKVFLDDAILADFPYNEGLIQIWKGDKVGFADETGKIIIPCVYKNTMGFRNGLAAVQVKNNMWGFVDKNNKIVIDFKYSACLPFRENLAGVMLNNKWGYINKDGKTIIPFDYEIGGWFVNGLAKVKLKGKCGFISPSNQMIIPAIYDEADNFTESYQENEKIKLAVVKLDNKLYKIGTDGKIYYEYEPKNKVWKKTNNNK